VAAFAVGFVGDVGRRALSLDEVADPVGILGLVAEEKSRTLEATQKQVRAQAVGALTGAEGQLEGSTLAIGERMDLGGQSPSATAHTTNSTPFFAQPACW